MDRVPFNYRRSGRANCKQSEITYRAPLGEDTGIDLRVNSFVAAFNDQVAWLSGPSVRISLPGRETRQRELGA